MPSMNEQLDIAPPAERYSLTAVVLHWVLGLVLVGAGGGGTFMAVQAGMLGEHGEEKPREKDLPKLLKKGDEDPYAAKSEGKEGEGPAEIEGEGGSE